MSAAATADDGDNAQQQDGDLAFTWAVPGNWASSRRFRECTSTVVSATNNYSPILSDKPLEGGVWEWGLEVRADCSVGVCEGDICQDSWLGRPQRNYNREKSSKEQFWGFTSSHSIYEQVGDEDHMRFSKSSVNEHSVKQGELWTLRLDLGAATLRLESLNPNKTSEAAVQEIRNVPTDRPLYACCGCNAGGGFVRLKFVHPPMLVKSARKR